jgi:magnesium chelatase family protein
LGASVRTFPSDRSLLPDLELAEALGASAIRSVAGLLPEGEPLLRGLRFIDPHHTAIVGCGARIARPGSISLAHRGVLFLDEAT